jgi:transitional endoplasmic reticulum ATPase
MSNIQRLEALLHKAEGAYKKGLSLHEARQYQEARTQHLLAAENLLMAAKFSPPLLAKTRREIANKLLVEADTLKKKPNQQIVLLGGGSSGQTPQKDGAIKDGSYEQSTNWLIHEKPSVCFDDVAGLDDVKEQIHLKLIYPFQHPDLAYVYDVHPGGGILLYGPPGTGKNHDCPGCCGRNRGSFLCD